MKYLLPLVMITSCTQYSVRIIADTDTDTDITNDTVDTSSFVDVEDTGEEELCPSSPAPRKLALAFGEIDLMLYPSYAEECSVSVSGTDLNIRAVSLDECSVFLDSLDSAYNADVSNIKQFIKFYISIGW